MAIIVLMKAAHRHFSKVYLKYLPVKSKQPGRVTAVPVPATCTGFGRRPCKFSSTASLRNNYLYNMDKRSLCGPIVKQSLFSPW